MLYLAVLSFLLPVFQAAAEPAGITVDSASTLWGNDNIVVRDRGKRTIVRGKVYYSDQSPAPDALIEIYVDEGNQDSKTWLYSTERIAFAKSRPDGSFEFPNLPVGRYEIRCSREGYQTFSIVGVSIVKSLKTKPKDLSVFLMPAT